MEVSAIKSRVELINPDNGIYAVRGYWLGPLPAMSSYAYIVNTCPENGILVIDTCGCGSGRIIADAIKETGLRLSDVAGVAVTHWHKDHTGGLAEFVTLVTEAGAEDIKIFMHEKDLEIYRGGKGRFIRFHPIIKLPIYHSPGKVQPENNCEYIALNDCGEFNPLLPWGIEYIHAPGHTPGNLSFYQPGSGALFSGSGILVDGKGTAGVSPVFYNREEQLESARRLMKMDFKYLYPAHMKVVKEVVTRDRRDYIDESPSIIQKIKGFLPLFNCPGGCDER